MGNMATVGVDPDGQFVGIVGAAAYLLFTEKGYEIQKHFSPIAIHINLHLGSDIRGVGGDVSVGIPKALPFSYRKHWGATYYTKYYDNSYKGWETRSGGEYGIAGIFSYSGTKYKMGIFTQTTNIVTIGVPGYNLKYENDMMFDLPKYFPGVPAADEGDRLRTAALQINYGIFSAGFNLFTGDPGLNSEDRAKGDINGREHYVDGPFSSPDKYRFGAAYFGVGPFKVGRNSEGIRNYIQNKIAHDKLQDPKVPYFKVLPERKKRWFFYFGTGFGGSLW
jgi:hypothetical protein